MKKDFVTVNQTSGQGNGQIQVEADLNTTFQEQSTTLNVDTPTVHQVVRITQYGGFPILPVLGFEGFPLKILKLNAFQILDGNLNLIYKWYPDREGYSGILKLTVLVPKEYSDSVEVKFESGTFNVDFKKKFTTNLEGNIYRYVEFYTDNVTYWDSSRSGIWGIYVNGVRVMYLNLV